ncbi:MAG: hypothetical protein MJY88_00715 [Bacteroidales bacterium]|nr:hypothetical protein [Bacteroidales bacterium]
MKEYKSKHGVVKTPPYQLYMSFVDMRNFLNMLPEDKKAGVEADYDTISASVQGFNIGVKVYERVPYSRISIIDNGAPFGFKVDLCFDSNNGDPYSTDFHIDVEADLNFMMGMMIGSKIQEGLDKIVQSLVDLSNGVMPEGFDPSMYPDYFKK